MIINEKSVILKDDDGIPDNEPTVFLEVLEEKNGKPHRRAFPKDKTPQDVLNFLKKSKK